MFHLFHLNDLEFSAFFGEAEFEELLDMADELNLTVYLSVIANGMFGTSDYSKLSIGQKTELILAARPILTYAYAKTEIGGDDGFH